MAAKTHYAILEVEPTATTEEIRQNWRLLRAAWHPDKFKGDSKKLAEERFKEIEQAYGVLSDPQKRADYDRYLAQLRRAEEDHRQEKEAQRRQEEESRRREQRQAEEERRRSEAEKQRTPQEESQRQQQQREHPPKTTTNKRPVLLGMVLILAILALVGGRMLLEQRPEPGGTPKTVSVAANQPWTDTGLNLAKGSTINISAGGTIKVAGSDTAKTPDGVQGCKGDKNNVAPDLTCVALIGRIGNGAPFEVGRSKTLSAPTAGRLYLGVNDSAFDDNSGKWDARITVSDSR